MSAVRSQQFVELCGAHNEGTMEKFVLETKKAEKGPCLPVAVIGTGLIGKKHIELVAQNANLSLAATVNPSGAPADIAQVKNVPNFACCGDMLKAVKIGGAIIASPNETHADIAIELMRAGVPVLIEKPIAGDIEQGRRIVAAAEKYRVPVLMGHHRRHNPIIEEMRQIIDQGTMGPLVAFSGVWSVYKPDPYYRTAWRTGPSGGPIMINLIHEIDYLHAMLGSIRSVGAMQPPKRRSHSGEEAIAVLLQFEHGPLGSIVLSDSAASPWSWEQATGENDPAFPMNKCSHYRFLFQRGAVEFPSLKTWEQDEPSWNESFTVSDPDRLTRPMRDVFVDQISHFYEVAIGAVQPKVTAKDGLEALNVAVTVKRIIADGGGYSEIKPLEHLEIDSTEK